MKADNKKFKIKRKPKRNDYDVGNCKPPKKHQFKKGQVGNPYGYWGKDPEKRALRDITTQSLKAAIEISLTESTDKIKAMLEDKETSAGHKIILQAVLNAVEHGDYARFDFMLERCLGKVKTVVDVTSGGRPLGEHVKDKEKLRAALKQIEEEI